MEPPTAIGINMPEPTTSSGVAGFALWKWATASSWWPHIFTIIPLGVLANKFWGANDEERQIMGGTALCIYISPLYEVILWQVPAFPESAARLVSALTFWLLVAWCLSLKRRGFTNGLAEDLNIVRKIRTTLIGKSE